MQAFLITTRVSKPRKPQFVVVIFAQTPSLCAVARLDCVFLGVFSPSKIACRLGKPYARPTVMLAEALQTSANRPTSTDTARHNSQRVVLGAWCLQRAGYDASRFFFARCLVGRLVP